MVNQALNNAQTDPAGRRLESSNMVYPTPEKWGSEFFVNSITTNSRDEASVAALSDGRFVVTFTHVITPEDFDNDIYWEDTEVRAQIFNSDGTVFGTEFVVNTFTSDDKEEYSAVCALQDGRFAVAFRVGDGDVRAQIFEADGSKSGIEFVVTTITSSSQGQPDLTMLADGRFVVTYRDGSGTSPDTTDFATRAQIFHPDGTKSGTEFLVNTTTTSAQDAPTIAALTDGRFVIFMLDKSPGFPNSQIIGQIFNVDGSKSGVEFVANAPGNNLTGDPSVAVLSNGNFVVAWSDNSGNSGDVSSYGVTAQIFGAHGTKIGTQFLINKQTSGSQSDVELTALNDGRFVAVWADGSGAFGDAGGLAIVAQMFNSDGSVSGAEFLVNTVVTGSQVDPILTSLADGRFVVAYTDASTGYQNSDIKAQIFDPRLAAVRLQGTDQADDFVGTQFADVLKGGRGGDKLAGEAGHDNLFGELGNDDLRGGGGNDELEGGAGDDDLDGGDDTDTAIFSGNRSDYSITSESPTIFIITDARADRPDGQDRVVDVEEFEFADGTVLAANLLDPLNYLEGTESTDSLVGSNIRDVIVALGGHDIIFGLKGSDTIFGGDGNDNVYGAAGSDEVYGEAGNDFLRGGRGADILDGGYNNDTLRAGRGDDILRGGSGNDRLYGGDDEDTLMGDEGKDQLFGGDGDDDLIGGADNDVLAGQADDDVLTGGAGADRFVFRPDEGADVIIDFEDRIDRIDLRGFKFKNVKAALSKFQDSGSASDDQLVFNFKDTGIVINGIDRGDLSGRDLLI